MSSSDNEKKISYFNTLIFTIVTGIISLCILGLLFFEIGQKMIYFIIAFEIGVFALIGYCLYRIISGENKLKKNKESYVLRFNECPDYYTRHFNAEKNQVECINNYIVKDRNGQVYLSSLLPTKIGGEDVTIPPSVKAIPTTAAGHERIILNQLEKDENFPKYEDKCGLIFQTPASKDVKYNPYRSYSTIPWTYMRGRCESFA